MVINGLISLTSNLELILVKAQNCRGLMRFLVDHFVYVLELPLTSTLKPAPPPGSLGLKLILPPQRQQKCGWANTIEIEWDLTVNKEGCILFSWDLMKWNMIEYTLCSQTYIVCRKMFIQCNDFRIDLSIYGESIRIQDLSRPRTSKEVHP